MSHNPDATAGYEFVVAAAGLPVYPHPLRWRTDPGDSTAALRGVVAAFGGAWVAPTTAGPDEAELLDGLWLHPVPLGPELVGNYLDGHCRTVLAPLYHGSGAAPRFMPRWDDAYRQANRQVAAAVERACAPGATVWVHDYHLMLVPGLLRARRPDLRIGFFLHSPFPSPERFATQPMRGDLLAGLCAADLLGFQHAPALANFTATAARYGRVTATPPRIGVFPTSVDVGQIETVAARPEVRAAARRLRDDLGRPDTVLLAIGAPEQADSAHRLLDAYAELLGEHRIDPEETALVYVAVCDDDPSHLRCDRQRLDRAIARVNGVHGRLGQPAVHYVHREPTPAGLVALYLAADVMLALPLADGMNLAAKEYLAARCDRGGRLVLSEFSGAAPELPGADLVNPYDIEAVKTAIVTAAHHPGAPAQIASMRHYLRRHDAADWVRGFLMALDRAAPIAGADAARR